MFARVIVDISNANVNRLFTYAVPEEISLCEGQRVIVPFGRGITPAGAGKTPPRGQYAARRWDHPRRCGENYALIDFRIFLAGSPPQVRGKPRLFATGGSCMGITPAGAGKTSQQCSESGKI